MPADKFLGYDHVADPARSMVAITPSDTALLDNVPKAIRCDVAGTVSLRAVDDTAFVSISMAAGEVLPIRVAHVKATGTTATLHGLY